MQRSFWPQVLILEHNEMIVEHPVHTMDGRRKHQPSRRANGSHTEYQTLGGHLKCSEAEHLPNDSVRIQRTLDSSAGPRAANAARRPEEDSITQRLTGFSD